MTKRFLIILILIFNLSNFSFADDIRDLQIEGIGIGDSLLDYYSSEEIELQVSRTTSGYKSDKFIIFFIFIILPHNIFFYFFLTKII